MGQLKNKDIKMMLVVSMTVSALMVFVLLMVLALIVVFVFMLAMFQSTKRGWRKNSRNVAFKMSQRNPARHNVDCGNRSQILRGEYKAKSFKCLTEIQLGIMVTVVTGVKYCPTQVFLQDEIKTNMKR